MNPASSAWDANRWRDASTLLDEAGNNVATPANPQYTSRTPGPLPSESTAGNPINTPSYVAEHYYPSTGAWTGSSGGTDARQRDLPRLREPYGTTTEASPFHARQYERHGPNSCRPHQLVDTSPRETSAAWRRSLHHTDRRLSVSADAPPLTLHIPQAQQDLPRIPTSNTDHGGVMGDLPRISTSNNTVSTDYQPYTYIHSTPTPSASLPPFASLKERANRADDVDGPDIASMSSRLSCHQCSRLIPLVKEVTAAVAELDENVQTYCNKSVSRTQDAPKDDSFRAVQWILDRLRYAKNDLQDAARRNYGYFYQQQQGSGPGAPFRNVSPPNPLKRPGEQWDGDDFRLLKCPRSGASNDQPQLPGLTPRDNRRGSIDFREHRSGFSPPPSESVLGSAHPRTASPTFTHRLNTRALPSPSSMAYPPSAAPSLAPATQSVGSPATSYQPALSIHTASTNSATSAHIADLQHQVTLKSLALQTLQSEYASLLQKLQRERVKSQTIEKKTNVADQEVNELTGKNEELNEQVKALESQLEESEKKREAISADAARDKEQWGRMLDMSGRLHAKVDSERQRLLEEKALLERRLLSPDGSSQPTAADHGQKPSIPIIGSGPGSESSATISNSENSLKMEVVRLNGRVEALRSILEKVRRHNQDLVDKTTEHSSTIDQALNEDQPRSRPHGQPVGNPSGQSSGHGSLSKPAGPSPANAAPPSIAAHAAPQQPLTITRLSKSPKEPGTFEVIDNGKRTMAKIAEVGRAASPGPEELGFHVAPTTSTPEELIRALGPIPAPLPAFNFVPQSNPWTPTNISNPSNDHADRNRRQGASPQSFRSSPGAMLDHSSSPSGSGNRSPEAYSEPEMSTDLERKTVVHSHPAAPPYHPHYQQSQNLPGNFNRWRPSMAPPPRPESAQSVPRTQV